MKQRKGFYSDGKLRWEGTFVDVPGSTSGVPHGWAANDVAGGGVSGGALERVAWYALQNSFCRAAGQNVVDALRAFFQELEQS